ncbi:hypothetical protein [Uliginosibacterium sp. H1]|uniref:hypothetical protein n=1 Tax=Uliginosibacterium sp. H1 TaxID=3114757 RepID=UPI002E1985A0|nr:hypothetical protein [Uliginosibacterium sp. H1]
MRIEVSIDTNAADRTSVMAALAAEVENGLRHHRTRLTSAQLHVRDTNGPRAGVDHRCTLEVRPAGLDAVAVSHEAATVNEVVRGVLSKMNARLGTLFGRQDARQPRVSASGLPT